MQDLLREYEEIYQRLLNHENFQQHYIHLFNHLLKQKPPPAVRCEREVVYTQNNLTLYHYKPLKARPHRIPLLIIYALVNRPDILDIQPDRSLIKYLLLNNIDIYLIDWGTPTDADSQNGFAVYCENYLHKAVKTICTRHRLKKINLMGICEGGVFSVCYAALHRTLIHKLITVITPIDFHTENAILTGFLQHLDTEALLAYFKNIPGFWLSNSFQLLKPLRLLQEKSRLLQTQDKDFFLRMERWLNDCPPHPGLLFHEFVQVCYKRNALIKNQLEIKHKTVDLSQITMPVLNIYATQDHLIPVASAAALKAYTGTLDYTEIAFDSGHIGLLVGKKALKEIPKRISAWLKKR